MSQQEVVEVEKPQDNEVSVSGVLDILENKTGQLLDPDRNGKTKPSDPFVPRELISRLKLKKGNFVEAKALHNDKFPNPKVRFIDKVDGGTLEERKGRYSFQQMVSIAPDEQIRLESKDGRLTTRIMDLFCPIGKGTRGLIVAPPRTGKTTILQDIAHGVVENHPECHCMVLLVDERPEEVTDFKRSVKAEIYASSNDEELHHHLHLAEIAIERAKRQLFYSLIRWNLPIPRESDGTPHPLEFDFLADTITTEGKTKAVLTGHDSGLITLNIAEGDDAEREARRSAMGEPFRTLVGHMRHEIAHYYWDVLVRNTSALSQFRQLFGDESVSYKESLKQHYENGAPADWAMSHVSAYATSHPWEDFAETFAHWLHMVDGLETAWAYDIHLGSGGMQFDPYAAPGAQSVIDAWVPVTIAINAVNRSLGQPDLYPFVLSAPVVDKLQFIHGLIAPFRA